MAPASRPFSLTSFYPLGQDPFHCSLGGRGGGGHTSAPHWICSWASPTCGCQFEKQAHAMISRQRTYIQHIVLHEGVHTIHYFALVSQQRGSCILMYALAYTYTNTELPQCCMATIYMPIVLLYVFSFMFL